MPVLSARSTSLRRYRSSRIPIGVVRSATEDPHRGVSAEEPDEVGGARRQARRGLTWELPRLGRAGRAPELVEQELALGRLAGPVEALEDNEQAARRGRRRGHERQGAAGKGSWEGERRTTAREDASRLQTGRDELLLRLQARATARLASAPAPRARCSQKRILRAPSLLILAAALGEQGGDGRSAAAACPNCSIAPVWGLGGKTCLPARAASLGPATPTPTLTAAPTPPLASDSTPPTPTPTPLQARYGTPALLLRRTRRSRPPG